MPQIFFLTLHIGLARKAVNNTGKRTSMSPMSVNKLVISYQDVKYRMYCHE